MLVKVFILFLIPITLLGAAWRQFARGAAADTITVRRRFYFGAAALTLASLATLLELTFFFSWFQNGGRLFGRLPEPGIWSFVGRIAFGMFLASVFLTFFGKGKWRIWIVAWMASLFIVIPLVVMLDMD